MTLIGAALTTAESVALPKVLLHDHLDGGLRPSTVIELADASGWTLPSTDVDELQAWFTRGADTDDILQYLATFEHTCAVMQHADHLERVAAEAVADLAADGCVYAEVRFAPELHQAQGLALDEVVEAVTAGFRRGEAEAAAGGSSIVVNAILCAMRTEGRSVEIAHLVDRMRAWDDKVVAFDLAGAETGFPPSLHAEALAFARRTQQNITIHASEPPDLTLISEAIEYGAHRIGHGVRLQADIEFSPDGSIDTATGLGPLARHVLDRQVHLEMAPTCHVHIGAVESIATHPIAAMLRAGFNVGVNTDNRLMSGVMPSSEFATVANAHDLTADELRQLNVNAIRSAFCPIEQRRSIAATL
ncbi:MAG: adenosine deaminase [Ilumatobacter sp.]|uniref:adenosine deaminase n=1 Tax=Ilumatobacter sp. TaxID=1967498 RepID=UPI003297CA5F